MTPLIKIFSGIYLARSHTLHTHTGNTFSSTLFYCRVAEKCKTLCFQPLLHLPFIYKWLMLVAESRSQLGHSDFCRSCSVPDELSLPGPQLSLCYPPQAQEQSPIPPSVVPSPSAAQIRFKRWPQPAGWINPCGSPSPLSSGFSTLNFSVPFGESFRSCSSDPFLVVFSCRQPQQQNNDCRCYSSSSSPAQRNQCSYHQWVEAMCVHGQRTAPRGQRFTPIHHCSYWTTSGKSPHPPVVQLPPVKTGIASSPCTIY